MTRPLEDTGEGSPGRARQRWAELLRDPAVRYWAPREDGRSWIVLWVGHEPAQVWRKLDADWAERIG